MRLLVDRDGHRLSWLKQIRQFTPTLQRAREEGRLQADKRKNAMLVNQVVSSIDFNSLQTAQCLNEKIVRGDTRALHWALQL